MEEGIAYRRRRGGPEDFESSGANPVAGDLPIQSNDALGLPASNHDEVAAGADRDLSVTMEPRYETAFQERLEDGRAAMATATNNTGPGATSVHAEEPPDDELIPHQEGTTLTAKESFQMQVMRESMQRLLKKNAELEERLRSENARTSRDSNELPTTKSKTIAMGEEGSQGRRFLERSSLDGEPYPSRQVGETPLGRVDMRALEGHFRAASLPGPSYQCEVRPGRHVPRAEPNSDGATGTSNASHDLLELGEGEANQALPTQVPRYVEGLGWVIPIGPSSVGDSSGMRERGADRTPLPGLWVGSPQPMTTPEGVSAVATQPVNPIPNPWVVNSTRGLVSVSNPWVQQAEGDWMERRRMDLEVEISKRARQTEAQRVAGVQGALTDKLRDEGFDTARSHHPVPPLDLSAPSANYPAIGMCPLPPSAILPSQPAGSIITPQQTQPGPSTGLLQPAQITQGRVNSQPVAAGFDRQYAHVPLDPFAVPDLQVGQDQAVFGCAVPDALGLPQELFDAIPMYGGLATEVVPPPPPYPPPLSPRERQPENGPQHTPGGTPVPPPRMLEGEVRFDTGPSDSVRNLTSMDLVGQPTLQDLGDQDERAERLERYIPDLPMLSLSGDASTIVSDWLALATPIISSLSPSAGVWWRQVVAEAQAAYARWLITAPTHRLGMEPDKDGLRYRHGKYTLLEQRVLSLLLKAMPEAIRQDVLNHRAMSSTAVIFKALCKVQPGSAVDKSAMLAFIVNPPTAKSVTEALSSLQKWVRVSRRTVEVHAQLPDPSLQLAGLDKIVQATLPTMPAVLFRVNTHRESHRLDYNPTQRGVDQLALLLISELEWTTLHAPDLEPQSRPTKAPRLFSLAGGTDMPTAPPEPGKGKGKGKDKGRDSPKNEGPSPKSAKPCKLFGVADTGCTYGSQCRFSHDVERAKKEQLCFHCGRSGHMSSGCPIEHGRGKGEDSPKDKNTRPRVKAKASARRVQGSAGAENATVAPPDGQSSTPAAEALAAATRALQELSLKAMTVTPSVPEIPEITIRSATQVGQRGLLDGGATHPLRQAEPGEWEGATPVEVRLAVGQSPGVRMTSQETLITQQPVQPIVPLGRLTKLLKCKVKWDAHGCEVQHPLMGKLPAQLVNGCPELSQVIALNLIRQLEVEVQRQKENYAQAAAIAAAVTAVAADPMDLLCEGLRQGKLAEGVAAFARTLWPELPVEVLQELVPCA